MLSKDAKEFGCIYQTTNYSMFKNLESNRNLNPLNYEKLLKSMKEEQLIIPICVNEKYEVIDGQHRLKACEELKLPLYFYVISGYTSSQMKRANLVSANWSKDDFLNAYVKEGVKDYMVFAQLKERYGLNSIDLIKIIAKLKNIATKSISLSFEEGNFKINNNDKELISKFLISLEDFKFFKLYKRTKFIGAFLELYCFEDYNHEIMKSRLKTRSEALDIQMTKDEYIKLLTNKIYSFGTSKNNIFYDVDRKKLYILDK